MHMVSQSVPADAPAELCLRFPCSACQGLLFIPVSQLTRTSKDRCPACKQQVTFPSLNDQVAGYKQVVSSGPLQPIPCPSCRKALQVGREIPGTTRQCPACRAKLTMTFVAAPADSVKPRPAVPEAPETTEPPRSTFEPRRAAKPSPPPAPDKSKPRKPSNERSKAVSPAADRSHAPDFGFKQSEPVEIASLVTEPQPIVYGGQSAEVTSRRGLFDFSRSSRTLWWTLYIFFYIGLPILAWVMFVFSVNFSTSNEDKIFFGILAGLACPWLSFGWFPSRYLASHVAAQLITHFQCPGCGEDHPARAQWKCSCGFSDYREMHGLLFRCPRCRKGMGYLDCERCGVTMII